MTVHVALGALPAPPPPRSHFTFPHVLGCLFTPALQLQRQQFTFPLPPPPVGCPGVSATVVHLQKQRFPTPHSFPPPPEGVFSRRQYISRDNTSLRSFPLPSPISCGMSWGIPPVVNLQKKTLDFPPPPPPFALPSPTSWDVLGS